MLFTLNNELHGIENRRFPYYVHFASYVEQETLLPSTVTKTFFIHENHVIEMIIG